MLITLVGGCFTQQGNLPPEHLYHRRLLADLHAHGLAAEIDVVRYERLVSCLPKVWVHEAARPSDWLVLHVRTEPVVRLLKLFYRYHDVTGRQRHVLNLPRRPGAAAHEPLADGSARQGRPAGPTGSPSLVRDANCWLGALLGNQRQALAQYMALIQELADRCRLTGTRLLLVGPADRPASHFEQRLARTLDRQAAAVAAATGTPYVRLLDERTADGTPFFFPNRVHVSASGHQRVAARLLEVLLASAEAA